MFSFSLIGKLILCSGLMIAVSCFANDAIAQVDVEGQPLAANVQRVINTLEALGHPLPAESTAVISQLIADQDADGLQKTLDPFVIAAVTINPEERVSVKPGSANMKIQQFAYLPLLIKVINQSTSTPKLNINSPQSGAVYAGTSEFSLKRQQQTELAKNQNPSASKDRFFDIELYRSPPMTETLSGLEAEYVVAVASASEAGKREVSLLFDIGDDTKDLGFRHQLPLLLDIQPALPVRLKILDADGQPTMAKLEIRDKAGHVYPPQAKRLAPDFFFQPHVYRADGESIQLPAGEFNIKYSRGPEYRVLDKSFTVDADNENRLELQLQRWVAPRSYGFYGGDHHIHAAGCSHYTLPTEGVSPEDMFRQVKGEGLNVGCVLTWGPCFDFQRRFFQPKPNDFGDKDTLLKYDLEISGFGSQSLGHVCLLNLKEQYYPGSEGTKGWPTWTTPAMRWAKEQGGYAGYAHSASGLHIDPAAAAKRLFDRLDANQDGQLGEKETSDALLPESFAKIDGDGNKLVSFSELELAHQAAADQLPNYAIPEMNGVGAMEICVSSVAGVCDFISAMDTTRIQEWNTWYHLLNCGFPLKVSGETDFPCMSSRGVGTGRVYVQLGENGPLDFAQWCAALAQGRSYVSDGYAHALEFSGNGVRPGFGSVELAEKGRIQIEASVAFAPETPASVAQGTANPPGSRRKIGDTVELHLPRSSEMIAGGERLVEIVVNGQPKWSKLVPADGKVHKLQLELDIDQSSWIALRQFPQLHTNPVNVIVAGKPIRASRRSAQWCIDMTKLLWQNREKNIAIAERLEAGQAFEKALNRLSVIAAESGEGS